MAVYNIWSSATKTVFMKGQVERWPELAVAATHQVSELLQELQDVHQLLLHQRQTNSLRLQHLQLHLEQLGLLCSLLQLLRQRVLHLHDTADSCVIFMALHETSADRG